MSLGSTRGRKWEVMAACRESLAFGTDAVSAATDICSTNCKTNSASLVRQTFDVTVSFLTPYKLNKENYFLHIQNII